MNIVKGLTETFELRHFIGLLQNNLKKKKQINADIYQQTFMPIKLCYPYRGLYKEYK